MGHFWCNRRISAFIERFQNLFSLRFRREIAYRRGGLGREALLAFRAAFKDATSPRVITIVPNGCGIQVLVTLPRIFQVFFDIPGDVRRAVPQAGRGEGCVPDVARDLSGFLLDVARDFSGFL